ncbi:cholecystokinin receptor [Folsomia candida]|uniref:cholecystokinin receptor n=1 Tax=Folsomia candida TaxID=158441 RepID=UPI0016052319|nr:cholecystokinin receptor [Folsomia candida]
MSDFGMGSMSQNMISNFTEVGTGPTSEPAPTPIGLPPFPGKNFIIPMYFFIFFLSFFGNLLVILTLIKNRRMRTVTNVLLLNLAISDLLLGVFCMPFTLIGQILRNFIFGHLMCRLIPYFQAVSVSVAVWTLVAISLERYFAICRPLQSRKWQTRSHACKMIFTVWFFALTYNIPIAIFSELQPIRDSGRSKCREVWPNSESEKTFNLILDGLLFIFPLGIMAMAYSLIVSKLWKGLRNEIRHTRSFHKYGGQTMVPRDNSLELSTHSQYSTYKTDPLQRREGVTSEILTLRGGKGVVVRWKRKDAVEVLEGQQQHHQGKSSMDINHMNQHHHGHSSSTNHSTAAIAHKSQCPRGPKVSRAIRSTYTGKSIESKKKVIRMLFVLVAEFFLCWTPLHFVNTWYLFDNETVYKLIGPLGVVLVQLLAYVSSCCNPITYCFLNRKFRQAFLKVFQLTSTKGKSGPPTIGRGSDLSANDSLIYGVQGSTYNKSVLVLECENRV